MRIEELEIRSLRSLWKDCFHDSKEYMDYYFKYKLKDNQILALFDQAEAVSMIHLNPFRLAMNHMPIRAHYIVGVATQEHHRKKGLMRRLLIQSMEKMHQDKVPFTYLMPASDKIYTPFGFRYIYAQQRIHLAGQRKNSKMVEQSQKGFGTIEEQELVVQGLNDENRDLVVHYVNNLLKNSMQLYAIRTLSYYRRLQEEMKAAGGEIFVFTRNQEVVGVIPFMMEGDTAEVVECVIEKELTQEIMDRLLKELIQFKVINKEGRDEELDVQILESFFLDTNRILEQYPEATLSQKPIIMARITNIEECFRHITFVEKDSFVLKIKDDIITENNQSFLVHGSPKGCAVTQTSGEADVDITIEDLASFLFGYMSIREMEKQKGTSLTVEGKRKLANIKVIDKIYINEIV